MSILPIKSVFISEFHAGIKVAVLSAKIALGFSVLSRKKKKHLRKNCHS